MPKLPDPKHWIVRARAGIPNGWERWAKVRRTEWLVTCAHADDAVMWARAHTVEGWVASLPQGYELIGITAQSIPPDRLNKRLKAPRLPGL